jgi:hypothetical protein
MESLLKGTISTIDLLVLFSSEHLLFILKRYFSFLTKQTILIRRLNVLSLPPQQEFPDEIIEYLNVELSHVYSTIMGKLNVDRLAYTVPNNFELSRTNGSMHETSLGVRNFFLKVQSFAQYNPFKF